MKSLCQKEKLRVRDKIWLEFMLQKIGTCFFFFSMHVGLLYFKTLRRRRSHSRTHSETMHAASVTSHLIGGRHSRARPKGQDLFTVLLNFQSRREKISLHCHTFLWQHFVLALSLLFMYYSHLTQTKALTNDHLHV